MRHVLRIRELEDAVAGRITQELDLFFQFLNFCPEPHALPHLRLEAVAHELELALGSVSICLELCHLFLCVSEGLGEAVGHFFEKGDISSQEKAIVVLPGLEVDVAVGFLCEYEFVAHLFQHIHEGLEEVLLLFDLVLRVQLVQNLHFLHHPIVYDTHRVLPLDAAHLLRLHGHNKINRC